MWHLCTSWVWKPKSGKKDWWIIEQLLYAVVSSVSWNSLSRKTQRIEIIFHSCGKEFPLEGLVLKSSVFWNASRSGRSETACPYEGEFAEITQFQNATDAACIESAKSQGKRNRLELVDYQWAETLPKLKSILELFWLGDLPRVKLLLLSRFIMWAKKMKLFHQDSRPFVMSWAFSRISRVTSLILRPTFTASLQSM